MLFMVSKFAKQLFKSFLSSFNGIFFVVKWSVIVSLFIAINVCPPLIGFSQPYPLISSSVISLYICVGHVLGLFASSQIFNAIVVSISILMIYLFWNGMAIIPKPNYSVRSIRGISNINLNFICASYSSNHARINSIASSYFPSQISSCWIIVKQLFDIFLRKIHDVFLSTMSIASNVSLVKSAV